MTALTKSYLVKNNSLMTLQKDFNELFDTLMRDPFLVQSGGEMNAFTPRLEVKEDDKSYHVVAEIPGMAQEDIHVSLDDNILTIEGEKKSETLKEEKTYFKSEISYGKFYRTIPFNMEVNAEKVSAVYKDGQLVVDIEKSASHVSKAKKINIKKS